MDSQKELDKLKKQIVAYINMNIKARKKRQEINVRIEELFDKIKSALEGTTNDFEAEVIRRTKEMRVTPGVKWRVIRSQAGILSTTPEPRARVSQIEKIKGIGAFFARGFKDIGISNPEKLLHTGASPRGRKELAEEVGTNRRKVLDWVNLADLMRVKGVGEEYTALLQAAGVDTVPELAQRNPTNLHQKMIEVNEQKRLVRRVPSEAEIEAWVAQAKELPRVIKY